MTFGELLRYLFLLIFFPRSLKTMEFRMLRLLNKDRHRHGLPPVRMQEDLRAVARRHSLDMAQKDYFAHMNLKSESPADRLKISGISEVVSGENLAKIRGFNHPTQHAEKGLMESPGHRANILNAHYNVVGIGIVLSHNRVYYFTQNFARRNLIVKTKISKRVSLRKGLQLRGEIFSGVQQILWQIRPVGMQKVLQQGTVTPSGRKFSFHLSFGQIGLFEVHLFVDHQGSGRFTLANSFEVKVRKPFF